MNIELVIEDERVPAHLVQSAAAIDFASLLPLRLTLTDYASAEKIANLPRKLNVTGEPFGCAAAPGDICYYAPWGNIALFFKPVRYAEGLVRLGALAYGAEMLRRDDTLTVTLRSA